ncbi:MAG: hypothetical protein Q4A95_08080 [Enterococcus hirae]|nr:hypothetical protein [Enterococcus hirae]
MIGIITKLQSEGRQGIVEGIHIAHIAAFFLEEFDIMLLPRCLNDFSEYLASIINELREVGGQENKLIFLIEKCYRECFSDITPKLIHNRLSDYLFLPSQKNEDYTNKFLWIAWLGILLYKLLQTNIAFEIDDCFKLLTQEKERAGIHVLFTNHLTLDRFIGSLFRSTLYDKLDTSSSVCPLCLHDHQEFQHIIQKIEASTTDLLPIEQLTKEISHLEGMIDESTRRLTDVVSGVKQQIQIQITIKETEINQLDQDLLQVTLKLKQQEEAYLTNEKHWHKLNEYSQKYGIDGEKNC